MMPSHDGRMRPCFARMLYVCVTASALLLPACQSGGHFSLLGYSTRPNYDCNIRTVYVPIFKNRTFRKGLEFDLTRAVVREIEAKTPFKVVSDCNSADTEVSGTITNVTKTIVNINPNNEIREGEMTVSVEVVWKDLRTGQVLSKPTRPPGAPLPTAPLDPALTPPPYTLPDAPAATPPKDPPVLIQSVDRFIPELGQSITTGLQGNVNRLAVQIVSMMESPW